MSDFDASVTSTSDFMADSFDGLREQEDRRVSRQLAKQQAREQKQQLEKSGAQEYEALGQLGLPIEIDLTNQQSGVVWEPIGKR